MGIIKWFKTMRKKAQLNAQLEDLNRKYSKAPTAKAREDIAMKIAKLQAELAALG